MRRLRPRRFAAAAATVAALWGWGCVGGGNSGSETTNGISGRVRDADGAPVANALVSLLAEDYNPGGTEAAPTARTATDAGGFYVLEDLPPGRYHLEIADSVEGTVALLQDIVVTESGRGARDATVRRTGAIDVRIADFLPGMIGYLYVPGTSAWRTVDSAARAAGRMRLERVPAGRFDDVLLAWSSESEKRVIALAHDVDVVPDSPSVPAPFQTWRFSRAIALNTLDMGIGETLTDFPLLVRLDSGNFDFARAQPDGRDLRFAKADGTALPFQIERWDASARQAEIWVRIDTVRGNDAGQAIAMHWGRDFAILPAGPAVFDTAAGFATVYHLGEDANPSAGGYKDATPNANHATAAAVNTGARIPGVIGAAKAFSGAPGSSAGTLAAAMPPGFGGNASFTVSFWLRIAPGPARQTILDFGAYGTQQAVHWLLRADTTAQFGAYELGSVGRTTAPWQNVFRWSRAADSWAHVATVYDASRAALMTYVDGARIDSVAAPAMSVDKAGGLRIGKAMAIDTNPPESPLNGALDEVRFLTQAVGAARIKLDYLTQKP